MAATHVLSKKKLAVKTLAFGALSVALYTAFFLNSGMLMSYFTRGLYYAALPILTALVFSFVHGTFASNVWALLGVEPLKRRPEPRPAPAARPAPRRRPRPRAYINT